VNTLNRDESRFNIANVLETQKDISWQGEISARGRLWYASRIRAELFRVALSASRSAAAKPKPFLALVVQNSILRRSKAMANLDQLKQKYQPVVDAINNNGGQVMNLNLDGEQLYLKAEMDSEAGKNKVWDAIKAVDPAFADLKHDIEVKAGSQMYVVQAGDSLSKIAKHFYGDAQKYERIAKANDIENPDLIKVGQKLEIPAA
jgi:nucleoid-associated protein YgaU